MINELFKWLQSLSLRQVVRWLGIVAAKVFWHLPAVMLIRLPIRFAQFMIDPNNRMKAFIILTVFALIVTSRTLVKKAVERRERLNKRNVFQRY